MHSTATSLESRVLALASVGLLWLMGLLAAPSHASEKLLWSKEFSMSESLLWHGKAFLDDAGEKILVSPGRDLYMFDKEGRQLWKRTVEIDPEAHTPHRTFGYFSLSANGKWVALKLSRYLDTKGMILNADTGEVLVHAPDLFGYGHIDFIGSGPYIRTQPGRVLDGELLTGAALAHVSGKRLWFMKGTKAAFGFLAADNADLFQMVIGRDEKLYNDIYGYFNRKGERIWVSSRTWRNIGKGQTWAKSEEVLEEEVMEISRDGHRFLVRKNKSLYLYFRKGKNIAKRLKLPVQGWARFDPNGDVLVIRRPKAWIVDLEGKIKEAFEINVGRGIGEVQYIGPYKALSGFTAYHVFGPNWEHVRSIKRDPSVKIKSGNYDRGEIKFYGDGTYIRVTKNHSWKKLLYILKVFQGTIHEAE